MDVLIVGAGIAGLTLANALSRQGERAVVIERARTLEPLGLGLAMQSNGIRALEHIGLGQAVVDGGVVLERSIIGDQEGNIVREGHYGDMIPGSGPVVGIHRNALIGALTDELDADIRLGTTVDALDVGESSVRVRFSDGSTATFDLVVGADGLWSGTRKLLFPGAVPEYRNHRAWRTIVPLEDNGGPANMIAWGRGIGMGRFPVSDELLYVFLLEHGPDELPESEAHWQQVRRIGAMFGGGATEIVSRVDADTPVAYTPVYQVKLERYGRGPCVLIGDAAHAIVSMYAQGAALAIEDAVVLAHLLEKEPSPSAAIEAFDPIRRPRLEEARAICTLPLLAMGFEGPVDPAELERHPGNVGDGVEVFKRLWAGIDDVVA